MTERKQSWTVPTVRILGVHETASGPVVELATAESPMGFYMPPMS